ncbi:MAG: hypothetical protein ABFS38_12090 [Bacteroidota bacterium]
MTLVDKWNYQPNKLAQALKRGKSNTIGYLVPDIGNPFFARIARLIENILVEEGYQLIMGSTHEDIQKEDQLLMGLMNNQIEGLIAERIAELFPLNIVLFYFFLELISISRSLASLNRFSYLNLY